MRFFGHPLIWSVDLAQLLFIWLCFIGATRAMRERGHLGVDFLVRPFPHRYRLALVLGLEKEDITIIHNEIGGMIYRQYISKALKKGPLGQEETTFLAASLASA